MKKRFILIILLSLLSPFFAVPQISMLLTTLVIIEEAENGKLNGKTTPFSDGVFSALWNSPYIFFDMKIKQPLSIKQDMLDQEPFVPIAQKAGADSILLIKLAYQSQKKGDTVTLKIDQVFYNLFSLAGAKIIKSGYKTVNMEKKMDINKKNRFLKELGTSLFHEIYSRT